MEYGPAHSHASAMHTALMNVHSRLAVDGHVSLQAGFYEANYWLYLSVCHVQCPFCKFTDNLEGMS